MYAEVISGRPIFVAKRRHSDAPYFMSVYHGHRALFSDSPHSGSGGSGRSRKIGILHSADTLGKGGRSGLTRG